MRVGSRIKINQNVAHLVDAKKLINNTRPKGPHSIVNASLTFGYDGDDFAMDMVTCVFLGNVIKLPRILAKHSKIIWKKQ